MTSCKRCEDIHTAQKEGKTQKECKCDCHNSHEFQTVTNAFDTGDTLTVQWSTTDTGGVTSNWVGSDGDFAGTSININTKCDICGLVEDKCKCDKFKSYMDLPNGKTVPIWRIDHL